MKKQNDDVTECAIIEISVKEDSSSINQLHEIVLPNSKITSGFEAYRKLLNISRRYHQTRRLLELKIAKKTKGNKLWEIELYFGSELLPQNYSHFYTPRSRPGLRDAVPRGYLSCHRRGTFITYALWVDGCERWFDSFELAYSAFEQMLNKDTLIPII